MSEATAEQKSARMKEFMQLLPLTTEIAGLPPCHPDRMFTTDQMEARLTAIRMAYKLSRNFLRDIGEGS
ncbi:MAG: hypothetical protein ACRC8S_17590 [Fimbriiglobus sp.]